MRIGAKLMLEARPAAVLLVVACLLVSVMQSQEAYAERKKVSGTVRSVIELVQERVRQFDNIHDIDFRVEVWVISSTDPDWDNAHAFCIRYTLPTKVTHYEGYQAITHPGGDQTFVKYEAPMEQLGGPDVIYKIKGSYMGGTGKFKGIAGSITIKEKRTVAEGITVEWETEYQVE